MLNFQNELCTRYEAITLDQDSVLFMDMNTLVPAKIRFSEQIKAATAYCLTDKKIADEPNNFVWSCGGFAALCKIKSNAMMARSSLPPRVMIEQVCLFFKKTNMQMYISLKPSSAFTRLEKSEIGTKVI